MVVGNYTRMEHAIVHDHLTFGWIVFAVMLVPFFVVAHFLFPPETPTPRQAGESTVTGGLLTSAQTGTVLVSLILILTSPIARGLQNMFSTTPVTSRSLQVEVTQLLGSSRPQGDVRWKPEFMGATSQTVERFVYKGQEVLSLVVQYDHQVQGKELIFVGNSLFSGRWMLYQNEVTQTRKGEQLYDHRVRHLNGVGGVKRTIVDWYLIDGKVTTSSLMAKFYELLGSIKGDRSAYLIALAADTSGAQQDSVDELLIELSGMLQAQLSGKQGQVADSPESI
jgi:EpsI family protein